MLVDVDCSMMVDVGSFCLVRVSDCLIGSIVFSAIHEGVILFKDSLIERCNG